MTARPAPNHLHGCFCGCGETATAGRYYRPGHDARHVSQAFVGWLDERGVAHSLDNYWKAIRSLPTQRLQRKLRDRMRKHVQRPMQVDRVWELESELRRDPHWMRIRGLLAETDADWAEGRPEPSDRHIATTAIAMGWDARAICRRRS